MPKTRPTGESVTAFLDAVPDQRRREEGHRMRELFERVTGEPAAMWGPSIVGFGTTTVPNGTEWMAVGFSPRKAALTVYGVYDDDAPDPLLAELGPHTTGKGCLYLRSVDAVDAAVLEALIRNAWR
jgi:hypothetical protein